MTSRSLSVFAAVAMITLSVRLASGQTSPNLSYGEVPTAAQWNNFLALKQDLLGFRPLNSSGGNMTGPLGIAPSTAAGANLNIPQGSPPLLPNNGDIWYTANGLFFEWGGQAINISTAAQLKTYQYVKAINANSATSAIGGFDSLIAFVRFANSPGSNAVMSLYAASVSVGVGGAAGGDFETNLIAWLSASSTAMPAGAGLSANSVPTIGSVLTALRTSAALQNF